MANITINLDGNAEEGLAALEQEIGNTAAGITELTTTTERLHEVQQQQITVIHHHRDSLIEVATFTADLTAKVASLASGFIWLHTKQAALTALQSSVSTALATQAARWAALEKASELAGGAILKSVLGIGVPIAGATAALAGFEAVMARTGKRADELGNITTNLDRIRDAARGLRGDLAAVGGELVGNLKSAAAEWTGLNAAMKAGRAVWDEIDASATRSADQMIININLLRDYVIGMRDLEEAEARRQKKQQLEAPGYEALRRVNAELEAQDKSRARQAEITSITTVEGIETEIRKVRERAREMVQAGTDAIEIERVTLNEIQDLRRRRLSIEADVDASLRKMQQGYYDFRASVERQSEQARQEADRKRIADNEAILQRIRETRKEEAEFETQLEEQHERSRQIVREQAAADQEKKRNDDLQAKIVAAQKAVEVEKQKQAALKNARQQALEKAGVNGQDLLNMAKPQDVLKILQENAAAAAKQKAAAENVDLLRSSYGDSTGPERKKYEALLRKAQEDAVRQTNQQFARGNVDPQQFAQAQAQAAQKLLGAQQQQGKLSSDSVQAMSELIQATAEQQATVQALQRQVNEFGRAAQQLRGQAQQQRKQAQAGSIQ